MLDCTKMNTNDGQMAAGGRGFKNVLRVFERQVLLFPLLVAALAIVALIFGGRCETWQWWTAVAAVVGTPFLKRGGWRTALGAAGMFAALLLVLKSLLPPVLWDDAVFYDMATYHVPTAQLLIEGWNPMSDPLAEGICARLGLDVWGMAPVQVAFMPKMLTVFAAVAYRFIGDPTGLTIPGLAFLWLGVFLQTLRTTRGLARMATLAALVCILPLVPCHGHVDLALAFASFGLFLAMAEHLKEKSCDWLALGVWTIWMMNTKQNGVLAAFVFWVLFAGVSLWRDRTEWRRRVSRFAVFAAGVALAWGFFSWNPLVTSWRLCGHPFYPFATVDGEKWPVKDVTWDLRLVNDDMRQMGRAGIWVHEYVSPRLANAYYGWKTGKDDFRPERLWFYSGTMFMGNRVRWCLWLACAVLLAHPCGRLFAAGGLLLSFLVPKECIGYVRYAPWMSSLACLAVTLGTEWLETRTGRRRWTRRALQAAGVAVFVPVVGLWVWQHGRSVRFKAGELSAPRNAVHYRLPSGTNPGIINPRDFAVLYDYSTMMENCCRLLLKELGWETTVLPAGGYGPLERREGQRIPMWTFDQRQWLAEEGARDERDLSELGPAWGLGNVWDGFAASEGVAAYVMAPWGHYNVRWGERTDHIEAYYAGAEPKAGETKTRRMWRRAKDAARTWGTVYPQEAWKWLRGREKPF